MENFQCDKNQWVVIGYNKYFSSKLVIENSTKNGFQQVSSKLKVSIS